MNSLSWKKVIVIIAVAMSVKSYGQTHVRDIPVSENPTSLRVNTENQESFVTYCENLMASYISNLTNAGQKMIDKISLAKKRGAKYKQHVFRLLGLPTSSYCVRFGLTMQQNVQQQDSAYAPFAYYNSQYASCLDVKKEMSSLARDCHLEQPKRQNILEFLKKAKPYSFYRVLVDSKRSNSGFHFVTVVAKLDENKQQIFRPDGTPQFLVISGNGEHLCDAEKFFVGSFAKGVVEESSEIVNTKIAQAIEKGEITPSDINEYNQKHMLLKDNNNNTTPSGSVSESVVAENTNIQRLRQKIKKNSVQGASTASINIPPSLQNLKCTNPNIFASLSAQQKGGRS